MAWVAKVLPPTNAHLFTYNPDWQINGGAEGFLVPRILCDVGHDNLKGAVMSATLIRNESMVPHHSIGGPIMLGGVWSAKEIMGSHMNQTPG